MRHDRLSRDDLTHLAANRPMRRVYRDPPDLPVHFAGFTEPAPCGLPASAWAARTFRRDLVTCGGCHPRAVEAPSGLPPSPRPTPDGLAALVGQR